MYTHIHTDRRLKASGSLALNHIGTYPYLLFHGWYFDRFK